MQASDNEGHTDFTGSSETDSDDENTSTPAPPVQFIQDRGKRRSKFKRRKEELMAKSYELATLTGTQVLTLAVSETGLVYTFTTPRLQPLVTTPEGKNLIQKCLNAPHPTTVPGAPSSADAAPTPLQPDNTMEGTSRQQTIGMGSMDMREGSTEPVLTPEHRAKFAQKETSSEKKYIRDSRFWMADGNIILSVPDTSSTSAVPRFFLYRVHKSALARHSEVFEHMFSFSASPDSEGAVNEMYDGLPVVDMPDSKKHIDSLLEVLYEPWSLPFKHFDHKAGNTAYFVLEIAAKYEMDNIRQRIVAHIEDYWPRSLAAWDVFETRLKIVEEDDQREDEMDCFAQDPASAIALARRFDIRSILPMAFYDIARIPSSFDWHNRQLRSEDAVDAVDTDAWNTRSARWAFLSVADYHRICVGRERLRAKVISDIDKIFRHRAAKGCYNITKCRDHCMRAQSDTRERLYASYDILKVLREAGDRVALCHLCREEIKSELQDCRAAIWKDLCKTFALH